MVDTQTELAIIKYFKNNDEMLCDKVYNNGKHEKIICKNMYEVFECINNKVEYNIYMPI